jgi:hypothetical protein
MKGKNPRRLIRIHHNKAVVLRRTRQHEEAFASFQKALEITTSVEGSDSLEVALIRRDYGHALCDIGKLKDAEIMLQEASKTFQTCYGEQHPVTRRISESLTDIKEELTRKHPNHPNEVDGHEKFIKDSDEENDPDDVDEDSCHEESLDPAPKRARLEGSELTPPIEINFSLGNHHERLELRKRSRIESAHAWRLFLCPADMVDFRRVVRSVTINLHPTFVRSHFLFLTEKREKFEVSGQGWGMFPITVRLKLRHGFQPPEFQLVHDLSFYADLTSKQYYLRIDHHTQPYSVHLEQR